MAKKTLALSAVVALLFAFAQPATAATTPSKVGLVSIIAGTTNSLTLHWPSASNATRYEVFISTNQAMTNPQVRSAGSARTFKVTSLARGKIYCFTVRARNGGTAGSRSAHTCKRTVLRQGATQGSTYTVMTYNICSEKCTGWSTRGPLAAKLILTKTPDVLALQEARGGVRLPANYVSAQYWSSKELYYNSDTFDLASTQSPDLGCDNPLGECLIQTPRAGHITMSSSRHKYAVWAELIDKTTQKHTIFMSVHTSSGKSDADALYRKSEVTALLADTPNINPAGLPIVFAGDFNSHRNRPNDYLAAVFHRAGYWDAYELAGSLTRPNYNSYNGFSKTPIISKTWGDHVDHIWVKTAIGVRKWEGVAFYANGRYTTLPSDHSPVSVRLTLP